MDSNQAELLPVDSMEDGWVICLTLFVSRHPLNVCTFTQQATGNIPRAAAQAPLPKGLYIDIFQASSFLPSFQGFDTGKRLCWCVSPLGRRRNGNSAFLFSLFCQMIMFMGQWSSFIKLSCVWSSFFANFFVVENWRSVTQLKHSTSVSSNTFNSNGGVLILSLPVQL